MVKRRLSPWSVGVAAAVLAVLALLAYGVASQRPDEGIERSLRSGERPPAPALELPRLDGRGNLALADLRGRVVVLHYWASWGTPGRTESPLLARWHRRMASQGGTVLGVDVLDVTADARAFVREMELPYPQVRDADGDTQDEFGVVAYPETLVIDRRGRIAAARRGPVDDDWMRREVAPLLAERA